MMNSSTEVTSDNRVWDGSHISENGASSASSDSFLQHSLATFGSRSQGPNSGNYSVGPGTMAETQYIYRERIAPPECLPGFRDNNVDSGLPLTSWSGTEYRINTVPPLSIGMNAMPSSAGFMSSRAPSFMDMVPQNPNHYLYPQRHLYPTHPHLRSLPPQKQKRRREATAEQRRAANIRERKRMNTLNQGIDELRKIVPTFAYEKKLSRIETLRLAMVYIAFMTDIVNGIDAKDVKLKPIRGSISPTRSVTMNTGRHHQGLPATSSAAIGDD